jgi:hypothetical protein
VPLAGVIVRAPGVVVRMTVPCVIVRVPVNRVVVRRPRAPRVVRIVDRTAHRAHCRAMANRWRMATSA